MDENLQKVLLIKQLLEEGFSEKVIVMITKAKQPHINKIKNGKLHKNTIANEKVRMTKEQKERYDAAKKILSMSEIPTSKTNEQDIMYMQLLKLFMVPKEEIQKLYSHISGNRVSRYLLKKGIDIGNFDSTLLGISRKVYIDLIIDYL